MVIGELLVMITGSNAGLSAALSKSEAEMRAFEGSTAVHAGGAAGHLHAVGLAALGVAAGAAFFGLEATKSAANYHAAMELIHTQAGATQQEVDSMTDSVLRLGPAVGVGPEELAAGLFHLESAGFRGEEALRDLTIAAEGAKVGHGDLEETTNALNATLVAGIPGIHGAAQAMGGLNAIVGSGDMRLKDLNEALGTGVLAAVKGFGVTFQDVGAALATFGDNNIRGADAATQLRLATMFLAAGTRHADDALKDIGLSTRRLRDDLASGGLIKAVTDLHEHFEKHGVKGSEIGDVLLEAFGKKAGVGLSVLVGQFERFQSKFEEVDAGSKRFAEDWARTQEEVKFKADQTGASIDSVVKSVGLGLLPAVGSLFDAVQPFLSSLVDWASYNKQLAAQILLVVGGVAALVAGLAFLGSIFHAAGAAIAVITSPIVLLIAAIGALAAHFGLLGDGAKDFVDGAASAFLDWIGQVVPQVLAALGEFGQGVLDWIGQQAPAWAAQVLSWGQAFIGWISPMIGPALAALGDLAGQVASWIVAQAPAWAAQVGDWAGAFVDWIAPMIDTALGALGDLAGQVIAWIGEQDWAGQLQKWAGVFIDWIGPMIDKAIGAIGDLATQVIGWLGRQVDPLMKAAGPVGKAILDGIIGALGKLPGMLGDAIGDATKNFDVSKVPGNLQTILSGTAIIAAVVVAGQIVGAAFAAATAAAAAVVDQIKGLLSAALKLEQAAIATAVGVVGSFVGSAFSAAFSVAATVVSGLATAFATAMAPVTAVMVETASGIGASVGTALAAGVAGAIILGAVPIGKAFADALPDWAKGGPGPNTGKTDSQRAYEYEHHAAGGWAGMNGPELSWLGEQGPEYVIANHELGGAAAGLGAGRGGGGGGQGGGTVTHVTHTHLHVDGRAIAEIIEERIFNAAAGSSSGFAGGPVLA